MKKILLATTLLIASATAAQARIDLGINIGEPAYVEPAPVYAAPVYAEPAPYYAAYGRGHHHDYDRHFWNQDRRNVHDFHHEAPHGNPHR